MVEQWEIELALNAIGLDEDQEKIVEDAIPIASKLLGHVTDNMQLFDTLIADIKLVLPAAKILLDAFSAGKPLNFTIKHTTGD